MLKLFVPHFKYSVDANYNSDNIGVDVKAVFNTNRKKLLFFGNLRKVKGIDIIVSYLKSQPQIEQVAEIVVAGKNVEHIDFSEVRGKCHVIDRHINDDELKYLYNKTEYVLLPYRDSSQSGILEMAFCFRKPMLLSNIPYFNMVLSQFPSFGKKVDIEDYTALLDAVINDCDNNDYYLDSDCDKFLMRKEIEKFRGELYHTIE